MVLLKLLNVVELNSESFFVSIVYHHRHFCFETVTQFSLFLVLSFCALLRSWYALDQLIKVEEQWKIREEK